MTDGTCPVDGACVVALETSDRSALEAFFTPAALALKVHPREADRTWLACGSRARLGLWSPAKKEFGDEGGGDVHFALSVPLGVLDVACVRLRELGVGFQGPAKHPGADRSLYCEDPAGNVLELWDVFERGEGTDGVDALASPSG